MAMIDPSELEIADVEFVSEKFDVVLRNGLRFEFRLGPKGKYAKLFTDPVARPEWYLVDDGHGVVWPSLLQRDPISDRFSLQLGHVNSYELMLDRMLGEITHPTPVDEAATSANWRFWRIAEFMGGLHEAGIAYVLFETPPEQLHTIVNDLQEIAAQDQAQILQAALLELGRRGIPVGSAPDSTTLKKLQHLIDEFDQKLDAMSLEVLSRKMVLGLYR